MFDTTSPSVLFLSDCVSGSRSPVISLAVENSSNTRDDSLNNLDAGKGNESGMEIVYALTRHAHLILMDSSTGNMINSHPICPKEKSTAISMHLLGKYTPLRLQPCLDFILKHLHLLGPV